MNFDRFNQQIQHKKNSTETSQLDHNRQRHFLKSPKSTEPLEATKDKGQKAPFATATSQD